MLNNTYGAVILGQPIELASILNRLQAVSGLPLLTSSDFEWGVQMRIAGATKFPRAMAFGATGDAQLAYEAGKVVGAESRALGVHLDFAPVADVNNNPRNPVINIRSFGEDPARALGNGAAKATDLKIEMADPTLPGKISEMANISAMHPARAAPAQGTGRCGGASTNRYEQAIRVDDDLLNRKAGWKQGQQRIGHGEEGTL